MTPLVVMTLLAAGPSPALLAKFPAVKPPITLTADTPAGPPLTVKELAVLLPAEKVDAATRVFAMGRWDDLLFVRCASDGKDIRRIRDHVVVLKAGAIAARGLLASQELAEHVGARTTVVVAADRTVTETTLWSAQLDPSVMDDLDIGGTGVRHGTLGSDGVTWGPLGFSDVQGSFTDAASKERLDFAKGTADRVFYTSSAGKRVEVKVEGAYTARALTLRFKDGKPHALAVDEARKTIVCTNPDGTTQTFTR